jgi:acyl-CoA thioester hydrolase
MTVFCHELRVRYHETDAQHHLYNARYLEYIDVAMVEYLRHLGWRYEELVETGFDPVLARVELDFHQPATFDENLQIQVWPKRVGNASFALGFAILGAGDRPVADASISYVNYDALARGSRPIPAAVRAELVAGAQERPAPADG